MCAWEGVTGGRLRTLGTYLGRGAGGRPAGWSTYPPPHHPDQASSPGHRLPLPLAPVARGQPQMALWPGDKGHTVPSPGVASGWVTLSSCVPIWGRGQMAQGDRPFSHLPSPLTP